LRSTKGKAFLAAAIYLAMRKLEGFKSFLSSPRKIVITTHHKPDADALGSSLALYNYLVKKGHDVQVISPTDYPRFLSWMAGNDHVMVFEGHEKEAAMLIAEADLIACLDFSAISRINDMGPLVLDSAAKILMMDHHPDPENFADFVWHDTTAASTAELIFELITYLGDENLIDAEIGACIYAGIMTDTGSFKHPNTTQKVHLITAELIGKGVDTNAVARAIYDTNTESRLRLMGFALSERLVVLPEYKTAYITLSAEDLERFHAQTGDTEGLVNYALSIDGIEMAAIIVDRTKLIKMSFRSVGDLSVNAFARAHFHGGGHKNAAGGQSHDTLEATVEKFLSLLPSLRETA
jgi:phosphoesterase RecJ-like protein